MSTSSPPLVHRAGPFELTEAIPLPGSGPWFRAERVVYSRGTNAALVCTAPDRVTRDALRAAHEALLQADDARLPSPVGWYEGVGALAVSAQPGLPLTGLCSAPPDVRALLDHATLIDIALELCEALAHLHDIGVVHGAVTPDHATLGTEGHVVLWGLGEELHVPYEWQAPDRGPASMASEQYSLGTTIAFLFTGEAPPESLRPDAFSEWPGLGRVIARMTARNPADRYASMSVVRRELLRLARRTQAPSQRRELGAQLYALSSPPPSRSPMANPPRIQLPLPSTKTPATDIHEEPTARPLESRQHRPMPRESVPVVRPSVGEYVPTASVRPASSSFGDIEINPSAVDSDIAVVPVEFDDTDHGKPQPIGMSVPTDDWPVPTPDDVFGALEVADGDPLDAPMTPRPLAGRGSGPTAVPTTDPGFGTVSLDLDGEEDSFFSDAVAGVQGIENMPMNPRRDGPREPSMVERVAHGMVIANAALFALWFVVRVF